MNEIIEHFGDALLAGAIGIIILNFTIEMITNGGELNNIVINFMNSITG